MDVYRAPDEAFADIPDYPFASRWREQDGLRMHYLDEGEGDPVLLLHGEPTWSFLWRHAIPRVVAAGRRAVAPDYFGFGRSDKPTDIRWYSYDRHVESVTRLVEDLDLRSLTVVVHDWGGPIGLRFAVENPERVERLVILDTGISGGQAPSETWLRFRDAVRHVGGELDVGRLVAAGTARGLADDVRAAYDAPFPTPESKAGVLAFPELVPTEPEHPVAAAMNRVRDALHAWEKPALVVWGADDAVLSPRIAELFVQLIPGATGPRLVENASHFLQEDAPDEVAEAIVSFLI
ncbi:MAG: alpha/beta fold hydrolase [Actinobacteria bacterium]|nr:alpha/beta fold hydrolase [Actinomycetota bacterium]